MMKPEEIEQERADFEAWYLKTYQSTTWRGRTFDKWSSGVYKLQHVQDGWQAWIARAEVSMKGNQK